MQHPAIAHARRPDAGRRSSPHLAAWAALAPLIIATMPARAQGAPAMHYGAMDLPTSAAYCVGRARKAYDLVNVTDVQVTQWQVTGHRGNATVLVSCTPRTKVMAYLLVVATSTDSKAAEVLRNDVRTKIASMREI